MIRSILLFLTVTILTPTVQAQVTVPAKGLRILALGDSYTIGESVDEKERWPVQLSDSLKQRGVEVEELKIIATTGWRTDQLIEAIEAEMAYTDYDLVTLLIGVNNQYQGKPFSQYEEEFMKLIRMAIKCSGGQRLEVMVVSIPDYAYTPFGQKSGKAKSISEELDRYNALAEMISKAEGMPFINVTSISRQGLENPALVAKDGLHPSGEQYRLWVEEMLQVIEVRASE